MSPDNAKLPLLLVVVVMMEGRQANSPPHMTLKWPTNQRMDNDLRRCLYVCFSVGCELWSHLYIKTEPGKLIRQQWYHVLCVFAAPTSPNIAHLFSYGAHVDRLVPILHSLNNTELYVAHPSPGIMVEGSRPTPWLWPRQWDARGCGWSKGISWVSGWICFFRLQEEGMFQVPAAPLAWAWIEKRWFQ